MVTTKTDKLRIATVVRENLNGWWAWKGCVINENADEVWTSGVARSTKARAELDAMIARDCLMKPAPWETMPERMAMTAKRVDQVDIEEAL